MRRVWLISLVIFFCRTISKFLKSSLRLHWIWVVLTKVIKVDLFIYYFLCRKSNSRRSWQNAIHPTSSICTEKGRTLKSTKFSLWQEFPFSSFLGMLAATSKVGTGRAELKLWNSDFGGCVSLRESSRIVKSVSCCLLGEPRECRFLHGKTHSEIQGKDEMKTT